MKFTWLLIFISTIASAMETNIPGNNDPLEKKFSVVVATNRPDTFLVGTGLIIDDETSEEAHSLTNQTSVTQLNTFQTKHKSPKIDPSIFVKEILEELIDEIIDEMPQHTFFDETIECIGKTIYTGITCIPHFISLTLGITCLFSNNRELTHTFMQTSGIAWGLYYLKIGTSDSYTHRQEDEPPLMQSIYFNSFAYSSLSYLTRFSYFAHFGALHIAYDTCKYAYKTLTTRKK